MTEKLETYNLETAEFPAEGYRGIIREAAGRWQAPVSPEYVNRVAAAAEFLMEALTGTMPAWVIKEAIMPSGPQAIQIIRGNYPELFTSREGYTSSDFPYLLGDVLDRMMLMNYNSLGHNWRAYCKQARPLRDFRTVRRLGFNGAEGQYQKITEMQPLQYSRTLDEDNYTYAPNLYGLGVKLSFVDIMNDDLGAFDTIPERLGRGGRRTVEKFVTQLFFDASGPDATFFASGNGNLLSGNPDFAIDALGTAIGQLLGLTDADGEPILVEGISLVYGPGLHVTVNNVLNQLTVDVATAGGVTNQTIRVNNWIVSNIQPVMNPYIPIVCSSANGTTSWALFANPNTGRPAGEIGFLAGYDQPALFQKGGNSVRVGGGVDQMAGDFATMEQHYKGLIAMGGTTLDPKSAVASNGSNS